MGVIAIFLAAFAIPVTFESVIWVSGSGSLANVASFTPGAVGVTQATNALALDTCCNVPEDQAISYSTAQQLIMTAWNQVVALVLVVLIFGWTGGKQLVGESYEEAKVKSAEVKAERAEKKAEKKAAKEAAKEAEKEAKRLAQAGRRGGLGLRGTRPRVDRGDVLTDDADVLGAHGRDGKAARYGPARSSTSVHSA